MSEPELIVVGAGSAGMAAAASAAELGLSVEVIEERSAPGGNLHHRGDSKAAAISAPYAPDHARGRDLLSRFHKSGATLRTGTLPWRIEPDGSMVLAGATTGIRRPKFVIAATGAIERPVPFPGWTLPGVMTAGAAQLLLKGAAAVPRGDVVLAGTGPLLYLVAWQLLKVGAPPKAILDSSQLSNRFRALSELPGPHMLKPVLQGLRMIADLRKAGIRFHRADRIEAIGSGDLEAVVAHCGRSRITVPADVLLVHDGVIASTQFTRLAGCEHVWDARQHAHLPKVDAWGATSNSCIYVAGDCAGIDGGKAAEAKGAISALAVAEKLGRISAAERDRQAAPHRRVLSKERRLRRFLDVLYPPRLARAGLMSDETVLCRCENVTVGEVRKALQLGADGPGKLKAFTRAGMGPCQGRICGPSLVNLICASSGDWGAEAMMNIRPPLKPVPLRMIAGHDQ